MTPHYADDWLTVYHGDARSVLAELPTESVHCVVTSPPYWGLRDYGTAAWEGGDEGCDHSTPRSRGDDIRNGDKQGTSAGSRPNTQRECARCGARRIDSQIGLEPTPEQYVENMVAVFREVRRVLRSDGTVWLNLGDSYNSAASNNWNSAKNARRPEERDGNPHPRQKLIPGMKPKDLVGIPWRVAFALQADGWYLRSDIIWSKPNPMPESVTDRPTKSHEYLFLLSKSAKYYFDGEAVRRPISPYNQGIISVAPHGAHVLENGHRQNETRQYDEIKGANIRTVWSIATAPYPGAHFATFPPKLVEPCIKAGTSERGVCPECGAPWIREVEREREPLQRVYNGAVKTEAMTPQGVRWGGDGVPSRLNTTTTGWRASCRCEHDGGGWAPVGATVLDPFAGSGTTGMVAQSLSRRAVLIDLSMDYLGQAMARNRHVPLGI